MWASFFCALCFPPLPFPNRMSFFMGCSYCEVFGVWSFSLFGRTVSGTGNLFFLKPIFIFSSFFEPPLLGNACPSTSTRPLGLFSSHFFTTGFSDSQSRSFLCENLPTIVFVSLGGPISFPTFPSISLLLIYFGRMFFSMVVLRILLSNLLRAIGGLRYLPAKGDFFFFSFPSFSPPPRSFADGFHRSLFFDSACNKSESSPFLPISGVTVPNEFSPRHSLFSPVPS